MSFTSSPQQALQVLLGRRFATIPKDQLHILDQDGAWAVGLCDRQDVPQLPDNILRDLRSYYLRQFQTRNQSVSQAVVSATVITASEQAVRNVVNGYNDFEDRKINATHEDGMSGQERHPNQANHSSPERFIDWTPSPPRTSPKATYAPQFQSQIIRGTPPIEHHDVDISMSRDFASRPIPHHRLRPVAPVEECDDDDNDDEDMEVDLPEARETPQSRVNFEATRLQAAYTPTSSMMSRPISNETPFCAQPDQQVIPGTELTKQAPAQREKEPERRKRRRMQPIQFEGTIPVKRKNQPFLLRRPATSRLPVVNSSMATSSSSLIPATCALNSTQSSSVDSAPTTQPIPTTHTPIHEPSNPISLPRPSIENPDLQLRHEAPCSKNAYSLFISTYPSYTVSHAGNFKNFIKALLCLEYLQKHRSLRDFLYDDFIRAFSSGYIQYIESAKPGQEALRAIEWYNLLDGQPEFSQMIITKRNILGILELYSDKAAALKKYIFGKLRRENLTRKKTEQSEIRNPLDVSTHIVRTTQTSPPAPANVSQPLSRQLVFDAPELPRLIPTSSARASDTPIAARYFERMKSESRSSLGRQRSAEHEARLREHFRKAKGKLI